MVLQTGNPKLVDQPRRHVISEFVSLCKPRVVELLVTTALPAMFLAQGGFPHPRPILGVLIGGTLAAGSSNAINSIIEKNIDINMNRTRLRPMPQNRITAKQAWSLAISCQVLSLLIVYLTTNIIATLFTFLASFTYVVIYTVWLKPRTDQNIVIGGAAGAFPAIIGYSAVSQNAPWQAWVMFAVIFLWTPAHFWALAVFHQEDYRRGGFPMMPITRGRKYTSFAIFFYAICTVLASFLLFGDVQMDLIYFISAWFLGIWFIYEASIIAFKHSILHRGRYMRFFHISNGYLALLFITIAVDSVIG